MANFQL
jgi:hypothetical protein